MKSIDKQQLIQNLINTHMIHGVTSQISKRNLKKKCRSFILSKREQNTLLTAIQIGLKRKLNLYENNYCKPYVSFKFSDYIQSLENALNESKLQTFQTIERLQMSLEDHESRAFNVLNDNDFMKSAIEVQKEIADQKDITNFRGAMQQVTRLKQVLEKLHKDYIKMVSQGKQMHDDLQLFKDQNENLNKELDNQKITNENLIDIQIPKTPQ